MQTSHFAPRQFLPETIDLTDTAQLAPVFGKLEGKLDRVGSVADLEAWLRDHGEVCAALAESSSLIYITPTLWPDFRRQHFAEALIDYGNRQRRFGSL